jgi:hypothetical protein
VASTYGPSRWKSDAFRGFQFHNKVILWRHLIHYACSCWCSSEKGLTLLNYFPWKKWGLWDHHFVCRCVLPNNVRPISKCLKLSSRLFCWRWSRCLFRSFNLSKIMDIQTCEVDAKYTPISVGSWNCVCYYIFKGWITFNKKIFVKLSWKLRLIFCFMETTHELLHWDKWSLV